ncbi:MAG: hypothetical protein WC538_23625 [Thermoanaerobaculia bacterium]|jgi:hypothetical protein
MLFRLVREDEGKIRRAMIRSIGFIAIAVGALGLLFTRDQSPVARLIFVVLCTPVLVIMVRMLATDRLNRLRELSVDLDPISIRTSRGETSMIVRWSDITDFTIARRATDCTVDLTGADGRSIRLEFSESFRSADTGETLLESVVKHVAARSAPVPPN